MLNPPVNGKIHGLFSRLLSVLPVPFKANLVFKDFQDSPVYSSTFQACKNPVMYQVGLGLISGLSLFLLYVWERQRHWQECTNMQAYLNLHCSPMQ